MKKTFKHLLSLFAVFALVLGLSAEAMAAKAGKTLKTTMKKGFVKCGVSQGVPGFSNADASGNWTGIDVDVCRAVAAAVLRAALALTSANATATSPGGGGGGAKRVSAPAPRSQSP